MLSILDDFLGKEKFSPNTVFQTQESSKHVFPHHRNKRNRCRTEKKPIRNRLRWLNLRPSSDTRHLHQGRDQELPQQMFPESYFNDDYLMDHCKTFSLCLVRNHCKDILKGSLRLANLSGLHLFPPTHTFKMIDTFSTRKKSKASLSLL